MVRIVVVAIPIVLACLLSPCVYIALCVYYYISIGFSPLSHRVRFSCTSTKCVRLRHDGSQRTIQASLSTGIRDSG
jgi:hypothetical protein